MKAIYKQALTAFCMSAVAGFIAVGARTAWAYTVFTYPGDNCALSGSGAVCQIVGGTAINTPGLSIVYFDFNVIGNHKFIVNEIYRITPNDTQTSISIPQYLDAGFHEIAIPCTSLNANRSIWDYYSADVLGEAGSGPQVLSNIYGIGVKTL